jgi:exonuclease III
VQSLKNKLLELTVLLQSDLKNVNILCFTEHWLKEDQLELTNIEHFNLVSKFSRIRNEHGGSCTYVKEHVQTIELNYFEKLGKETDFEVSAVELLKDKGVVVCVYRSPDGDFYMFLKNLEAVIQKVQLKKKKLILCGDWNINFVDDSVRLRELKNLLWMYNLDNIVASPTTITKNSVTQIDVIIINHQVFKCSASVLDLGYSDHLAQILKINVNRSERGPQMFWKKQFTKEGILE